MTANSRCLYITQQISVELLIDRLESPTATGLLEYALDHLPTITNVLYKSLCVAPKWFQSELFFRTKTLENKAT